MYFSGLAGAMNESESNKSWYPETVLFCFVFGALMTLIYYPVNIQVLPNIKDCALHFAAVILLADGFLSASVNGIFLFPLNSAALGAVSAVKVKTLISGNSTVTEFKRLELIIILIYIPLHFAISVWGMNNSDLLREGLRAKNSFSAKYRVITYAIMLICIAAAMLLAGYILII